MNNSLFTLVTGNEHKLTEFRRLIPSRVAYDVKDIDLDEIQSVDAKKIVEHKAKSAYSVIGRPVIVEDVSAGLDKFNGLPGPFIKFFEKEMGRDALYQLAGSEAAATVTSTIGYYDGTSMLYAVGIIHGTVVPMSKGTGFGFDNVFVPTGQTKTFAELGPEEKDRISHRSLAVAELMEKLNV